MLTILLLALAGQILPATTDNLATPASSTATIEARSWTEIKHDFATIPIPRHDDDHDTVIDDYLRRIEAEGLR